MTYLEYAYLIGNKSKTKNISENPIQLPNLYIDGNLSNIDIRYNSMPDIIDYSYNDTTGETYIKWSDKTETKVKSEPNAPKEQYYGFMIAIAKKAMGNTSRANNLYDKWAVKKPIRDIENEVKRIAAENEAKRIAEKRRVKREKWITHKEAIRMKRKYEAKKLANEKYGVPMDFEG